MFSIKLKDILQPKPVVKEQPKVIYHGFKLPIHYLEPKFVHTLSPQVATDLELSGVEQTMYSYIMKPKHQFARQMEVEWVKQYTSHIPFLQDSQRVLDSTTVDLYDDTKQQIVDCDNVMQIWNDTKQDASFLEKYSYIEWEAFKSLNESPMFLQTMSVINMTSPILSFIIPIIFFIFPFVLLKLQGVPITFSTYLTVLKEVARNHFIGNVLNNMQSIGWEKLLYLMFTVGLYGLQIYQNYNLCIRFYKNMNRVNSHLCDLRAYLDHSISSMDSFMLRNGDLKTYRVFCDTTITKCAKLRELRDELASIQPFKVGFSKIVEIGYMLKCFYRLHADVEYDDALRYSIGFEGYISNIRGICENFANGNLSFALFDAEGDECRISQQYYPAYIYGKYVKNDCKLDKNIIITGPNASGKTTLLKTTMLNIIFTQQFGVGFYDGCILTPYTHIHSYLNIPDTSGRDSLFQAESRRCKEIIDIINDTENTGSRHFCIFDELYSGTNPSEAVRSARAFLLYLCNKPNVDFMLTTHYVSLCKKLRKSERIANYKMHVNTENGIQYTYKMKKGISKIKGGIVILEEMAYPSEILDMIRNF